MGGSKKAHVSNGSRVDAFHGKKPSAKKTFEEDLKKLNEGKHGAVHAPESKPSSKPKANASKAKEVHPDYITYGLTYEDAQGKHTIKGTGELREMWTQHLDTIPQGNNKAKLAENLCKQLKNKQHAAVAAA